MTGGSFDSTRFRRVLGQFPSGVVIITAMEGQHPIGMSVGAFTSVSLEPPLVAFLPAQSSKTWPKIRRSGKFCVNILAARHETVCRRFATSGVDKFDGVPWRPAGTGSPIIEGALAWIDCDLERVDDAGDHCFVLGRVIDLDIEHVSSPLVFFQGGYGRFEAGPIVAGDPVGDLAGLLPIVDRARGEIEALSIDVDAECVVSAVVGEEFVFLASAGPLDRRTAATLIGHRIPLLPPAGATAMAWAPSERVDAWLGVLAGSDARKVIAARLDRIRERGYAVSLEGLGLSDWAEVLDRGNIADAVDTASEVGKRVQLLFDPPGLADGEIDGVRTIHVPVFDCDGYVALILNLGGFGQAGAERLKGLVARTREAAERITRVTWRDGNNSGRANDI